MTVVLGVVSDGWSIVMTDTRMTFKDASKQEYDDSVVKLKSLNYPHGWFAGIGYSHYIDSLYHLASRCMISSSEQYLNAMAQVTTELVQEQCHDISSIIKTTCLRTFINTNHIELELLFINPNTNQFSTYTYPKDQLLVLFPADYTFEMQSFLRQKYQIEELHQDSFENTVTKLLNIFGEVSINSNAVSEICEIGIMKKDGPIKKFSLSGNINELITKIEKQNYFSNIF
ncbi:hypothetical protein A8L34_05075 [Bacillus sp. FJAT-27264]|uniref:hypothetical protein n=1 Tax=Paenibacillus sp. (strain DSM 101736 / FJAT-27264) TaxID=1850362 RepID=UPI000807CE19|nr:hypothetical protein [Bacillus sp. FJAT-27264]OBZ18923.1 hypothetical protein A8L34_05075 [Bacillus sp. FJAT-27264]